MSERPNLVGVVLQFFDEHGWPVEEVEAGELFETSFDGEHGRWPCRLHCYDTDGRFVFVSALASLVPAERRAAIAELCNRANFGLAVGNFELDHDGGEARFRTSLDALDSFASVELVRNVVVANVITFDQYLPAIEAVLAGAEPAAAVAAIEGDEIEGEEIEGDEIEGDD